VLLEHPENLVIGLVCYGVLLCHLVFAALAFGSPLRAAFLWASAHAEVSVTKRKDRF